jgi:hypothetical protein
MPPGCRKTAESFFHHKDTKDTKFFYFSICDRTGVLTGNEKWLSDKLASPTLPKPFHSTHALSPVSVKLCIGCFVLGAVWK